MEIIMQRFHAEMVANQQQLVVVFIEQSKSKNAIEFVHKCGSFFFIKMYQHFRIAGSVELMSLLKQISFQFFIIIQLAIEDDADAFVFIKDGLIAGTQVDDGKAAMTKTEILIVVNRKIIRTTMLYNLKHFGHQGRIVFILFYYSANATHRIDCWVQR